MKIQKTKFLSCSCVVILQRARVRKRERKAPIYEKVLRFYGGPCGWARGEQNGAQRASRHLKKDTYKGGLPKGSALLGFTIDRAHNEVEIAGLVQCF